MRANSVGQSFGYAWAGLAYVVRTQRNVRVQLAIAAAVVLLAAWLTLTALEWTMIVLCIGMVLAAEIANTALETVVDLASPDYHDLAKIAKDVSSAAVLCLALTAAAIGVLILGPPLWSRLFS